MTFKKHIQKIKHYINEHETGKYRAIYNHPSVSILKLKAQAKNLPPLLDRKCFFRGRF